MSVEFDMRAADSSPLGKLTHAIKTDVPEETGELLGFLAAAHRQTEAEYIRNLLIEHVHGKAEVVRMKVCPSPRSSG
jgi:hypothetical protein